MSLRQNEMSDEQLHEKFSYQSECHCAKTMKLDKILSFRLVTSQNVTAPKHHWPELHIRASLVTSQNVTAPKHRKKTTLEKLSLVTSQNVTAPKRLQPRKVPSTCLVTSQNVTAPKQ